MEAAAGIPSTVWEVFRRNFLGGPVLECIQEKVAFGNWCFLNDNFTYFLLVGIWNNLTRFLRGASPPEIQLWGNVGGLEPTGA